MLDKNEINANWANFKQFDGNKQFPTIFKFKLFGSTYYAAKDSKNNVLLRKSLIGLKNLTGIPLRALKKELL